MEHALKLLNLLARQRTKIIFRQANQQERTGNNIINFTVIIPERPIQRKSLQFPLLNLQEPFPDSLHHALNQA